MGTPPHNNGSPLRVLLVSPFPPPSGGIGRWAVLLMDWLQHKPGIIVRSIDISPRWRAVEDLRLCKRILGGGLQGVRDAWRCLFSIFMFRPHVIHVNTSAALRGPWDTIVLATASLLGVRSVYHVHMGRLPEILLGRGWEWWGIRWALRFAGRVVVLDRDSEQALQSILPVGRVVRLPNAIALPPRAELSLQSKRSARSVLYLGHIIPSKGINELIAAWQVLRPAGWLLRLAGLGSQAYRQELLGIVGQDAGVEFIEDLSSEQAWIRMQEADIFVLPSYTEGFPNVLLEAMAAGKAIISTRVGAVAEMLDAELTEPCGLVIEPRHAQALVDPLRLLMSDHALRETLGRRAQAKLARCYTTDTVFERLLGYWSGSDKRGASPRAQCDSANAGT